MLLPFRWLLYGTAATEERGEFNRRNRKVQRKLRKLAQWSEAIAPPRIDVVAPVQGIALQAPRLAPVRVSAAASLAGIPMRLTVGQPITSIASPVFLPALDIDVADVTVEAGIDLFDYEIAALMAA